MSRRRAAVISAVLFFVFWPAVLYAGADHPPPPGFILVVLLDLIAGLAVALMAVLASVLIGGGEPTVTKSIGSAPIWFAVLAGVGVANALPLYGIHATMRRRGSRASS